jgi:drug/metabolite transporter (DMT)-like permease
MGNVVAALTLLFFPSIRSNLFKITKSTSSKTGALVIFNRIIGGVAFLCVLYAIRLGSVSVVNALSSLQFVFVFFLIFVFAKEVPDLYHHEFRKGHILHKVLAMCFIIAGFFVLFL